jgi:hypothetical protein
MTITDHNFIHVFDTYMYIFSSLFLCMYALFSLWKPNVQNVHRLTVILYVNNST